MKSDSEYWEMAKKATLHPGSEPEDYDIIGFGDRAYSMVEKEAAHLKAMDEKREALNKFNHRYGFFINIGNIMRAMFSGRIDND